MKENSCWPSLNLSFLQVDSRPQVREFSVSGDRTLSILFVRVVRKPKLVTFAVTKLTPFLDTLPLQLCYVSQCFPFSEVLPYY